MEASIAGLAPQPQRQSRGKAAICQVEGCCADLRAEGKAYTLKRKICSTHMRSESVHLADGTLARYCFQCGKMEPLPMFEGLKRSCRASLRLRRESSFRRNNTSRASPEASLAPTAAGQGPSDSGQLRGLLQEVKSEMTLPCLSGTIDHRLELLLLKDATQQGSNNAGTATAGAATAPSCPYRSDSDLSTATLDGFTSAAALELADAFCCPHMQLSDIDDDGEETGVAPQLVDQLLAGIMAPRRRSSSSCSSRRCSASSSAPRARRRPCRLRPTASLRRPRPRAARRRSPACRARR